MTRVAIVAVVLLLYVAISASFVIRGPFPASAVVPVNSYGNFWCEVNTSSSELATGNYSGPGWTTWPRATSGSSGISNGGDVVQTSFRFKVTEIYLSGGIVQCRVTLKPSLEVLGANATVLAYGKVYSCDTKVAPKFTHVHIYFRFVRSTSSTIQP